MDPLVKLGVQSLKIEGRLKSAEYVAITSQTYRAAIDAAVADQAVCNWAVNSSSICSKVSRAASATDFSAA